MRKARKLFLAISHLPHLLRAEARCLLYLLVVGVFSALRTLFLLPRKVGYLSFILNSSCFASIPILLGINLVG